MSDRPRILCVDDERLNRVIVSDMLDSARFQILEAENGEEALKILQDEAIDIILLDINMPGIDGFEVCRRIKTNEHLRHIPVIMVTALTDTEDRIKGIEAGAEDYINKPFREAEVLARIKMLLKVKDLNEKLIDAYTTIKGITNFGESIIQTFHPSDFDLLFSMDSIVSQLIRKNGGAAAKPTSLILGVEGDDKECHFYKYSYENGKTNRTPMDLPEQSCAPSSVGTKTATVNFYNRSELENSSFAGLVSHLKETGTTVQNMVSFASKSLSLYALNYQSEVSTYEATVLESLVMQAQFLKSLSEQVTETEDAFNYTVYSLARAAEIQDEDTGDHIQRVGAYCSTLAEKLNMSDRFTRNIRVQATLHDIGKLHTSRSILQKPGKLDEGEWTQMKKHTLYGAQIIGEHQRFEMGKTIALTHHEKWDGTGYPSGLAQGQIPVEGRIMALADTYDALRSVRVYKSAFDHNDTCRIILEGDDRTVPDHFDPEILSIFRENEGEFEEIYAEIGE
ncbi:MAG: response regulator [bacterium]|nr:response regulator [bacterium]MDT8365084.1 response regulator [bacterium]